MININDDSIQFVRNLTTNGIGRIFRYVAEFPLKRSHVIVIYEINGNTYQYFDPSEFIHGFEKITGEEEKRCLILFGSSE